MKPTLVDAFCGVGGISKGFQNAGFKVLLGIDFDEYPARIFNRQFPKAKIIVEDIRNMTAGRILEIVGSKRINVLVGGTPCQGFSIAGRRRHDDPRNTLFYEFVRIAKELMPSWILIENVRGLASARLPDGKKALDEIYDSFAPEFKLKHFFVNAADFGVPQKRNRIIIVGNSKGIDFDFTPSNVRPTVLGKVLLNKGRVDGKYFYSDRLIKGFARRERINREKGWGFRWQFLKTDQQSYTIPARYWKDGANALVRYSESEIRMLTEKECARIQGLDSRRFGIGKRSYIAIGNAAPPKMIQPFAEKIRSYGF